MLYSIVEREGTGAPQTIPVPPYISRSHIHVYVNGATTGVFEWVNDQTISIIAPTGLLVRVIRRTSQGERLTDYQDGQDLPASDLDVDSLQAFYMAQEALDGAALGGQTTPTPGVPLPGGVWNTDDLLAELQGLLTLSHFAQELREEIERISGTEEVVGSVNYRLLLEAQARSAAISAETHARAAALAAEASARGAAISAESMARQSALSSLASQLTTITASVGAAHAAVQMEESARTTADEGLASAIDSVIAQVADSQAAIINEASARTTADASLASQLSSMTSSFLSGDAALQAAINTEATTRATADASIASRVSTLEASYVAGGGYDDTVIRGRIDSVETAIADEESARAAAISNIQADYTTADAGLQANITSANSARASADTALANRATALEAKVNLSTGQTVTGLIANEASVRAAADSAHASQISTLQAGLTGAQSTLATVQTSANTSATKLGNVEANYTIKVQARSDGKYAMAGIGLLATANSTVAQSELVFLADKFQWVPSTSINATPQALMALGQVNGANTWVLNSTAYGDKSIGARMIVDGGIEARHAKIVGGPGNSLIPDPNFEDGAGVWTISGGSPLQFTTSSDATQSGNVMRNTPAGFAVAALRRHISVQPGRRYRLSARVRKHGPNGQLFMRTSLTATAAGLNQHISSVPTTTSQATYHTASVESFVPAGSGFEQIAIEFTPTGTALYFSPVFSINWGGTAGWFEVRDIRLVEMVDNILIVEGGVKAENFDGRGATLRRADGVPIFGVGAQFDGGTYIMNGTIGTAKFTNTIQSDNYVPGSSGWFIRRSDGYIECGNLWARGNIRASSVTTDAVDTDGIQAGAITKLTPQQSRTALPITTTGNWIEVFSVVVSTSGYPVVIDFSSMVYINNGSPSGGGGSVTPISLDFQIKRNGVVVFSPATLAEGGNTTACLLGVTLSQAAGPHDFSVEVRRAGGGPVGAACSLGFRSIKIQEFKR